MPGGGCVGDMCRIPLSDEGLRGGGSEGSFSFREFLRCSCLKMKHQCLKPGLRGGFALLFADFGKSIED